MALCSTISKTQLTNQSDTSQCEINLQLLALKRSFGDFDTQKFLNDLQLSHLNVFQTLDPDVAHTLFSNPFKSIADAHAPFRTIHFNGRF